jgi:hypothetical protein
MNQMRFMFLLSCAEELESYAKSMGEASWRQNSHSARVYFDCIKAVGRSISATLAEIEAEEEAEKKKAEAA